MTPDARYLPVFTTIIDTRSTQPFNSDDIHDELTAAQVPLLAVGPLFAAACRAGLLEVVGYRPSRQTSRKGGINRVYRRTSDRRAA